ncbi:MAG: (R)-citramalate synthase [Alphaproteobacteria bacterium MarineAlpha5_Bin9]|nr:MAG: (R)-citramalate synthase [Alphaproteobacteria bacterium MarineAlpha5_Bin9]|tara:strand:+ start:15535 stop:17121 length:1587 start_codon:yes stop_codon:yes gene_type:complete
MNNKVYIFDTTLRDGQQTTGVNFTVSDKVAISSALDDIGIDYIEGGWPGANPTDSEFFNRKNNFKNSFLTAFGMTRKINHSAANDPGLNTLINSKSSAICIVGKSSSFQVNEALKISEDENIKMIYESIREIVKKKKEAIFDAEHFFDGFKKDKKYSLKCIEAAFSAGARWVILCDTNGGTLPDEIFNIVEEACKVVPGKNLGIHAHNDTDNAVANSLAALNAGVRQVQGTINGLGERCGNTNLISLIPTLSLKTNFNLNIKQENLNKLFNISKLLNEILNIQSNKQSPYVGEYAFSHKGGLHAAAVEKNPQTYEHIDPKIVGNSRDVVISDQAGKSNIINQLNKIDINTDQNQTSKILETIKQKEYEGYSYDTALASFEILVRREMGQIKDFFNLNRFRVTDERRWNAKGELITESEATVNVKVQDQEILTVGTGNGPVNAIDSALRKALISFYPSLKHMKLTDYKVNIISPEMGTGAITRVIIESSDETDKHWTTIGISANIIDASYNAIHDSITYKLFNEINNKK